MSVSFPFHSLFLASWQNRLMQCYSSSPKRLLISHLNIYSFQNSISEHRIKHKYLLFEGRHSSILQISFFLCTLYIAPTTLRNVKAIPLKAQKSFAPPYRKKTTNSYDKDRSPLSVSSFASSSLWALQIHEPRLIFPTHIIGSDSDVFGEYIK